MSSPRPPRTKRSRIWTFKRIVIAFFTLVLIVPVSLAITPTTRWAPASGYVMTDSEAEIRPSVEGVIDATLVENGEIVKKNQLIVQLQDSIQKAAYEQTLEELKSLKSELAHIKSKNIFDEAQRKERIFQARRKLEVASDKLDKMKGSHTGVFSQQEIIEAKLDVDVAQSQLDELSTSREEMITKNIEMLTEKIQAAEKKCALHMAELKMRRIRSPLDGILFLNRYEPKEVVKPEHVLGQVFDTSKWIVRLKLSEKYITHVADGQKVEVSLAAYPKIRYGYIYATVMRIIPVVTPQATGNGIFLIEASIDDTEKLRLSPGMVASAKINTGKTNWLYRLIGF